MRQIYFLRHQAAGVLWQHPFESEPSDAQRAALARLCFQSHGATGADGQPYWLVTVPADLLTDEVPDVPERVLQSTTSIAEIREVHASGVSHVQVFGE